MAGIRAREEAVVAVIVVDPVPEVAPPPPEPTLGGGLADEALLGATDEAASPELVASAAARAGDLDFSLPPAGTPPPLPTPAPAAGSGGGPFQSGVPRDFVFYARQKYPEDDEETAVGKLLAAIGAPSPTVNFESVVVDEVVEGASLYTHPSLYADPEAIDDEERIPPSWLPHVNEYRASIEHVLRSVGRIQIHHYVPSDATSNGDEVGLVRGTGVMIAPRIVMTNRHVADDFAWTKDAAFPFLKDGRGAHEPVVLIDFGGVYDEVQNVFRIKQVLYMSRLDEPDVALLELAVPPGREPPPPAPLQLTEPDLSSLPREAFVVGYPSVDRGDARVPLYFRLLRVKRVSLGQIDRLGRWEDLPRFFHSCTTLGGSSGSPLVDFRTGSVWGLHFKGHTQSQGTKGNLAEPMWRLAELPAVREVLATAGAGDAVSFGVAESVTPAPTRPPAPEARASRPVLFVEREDLDAEQPFPSDWFAADSAEHQNVRGCLPGIGLVQSQDRKGVTVAAATGFLIAPDLLLTFPLPWQKPLKRNKKQGVFVDFTRTIANEPPRRFRAGEELYRDDYLSLLRLDAPARQPLPPPVTLQRTRPDGPPLADERVFVVGHPAGIGIQNEAVSRLFPPPYGVKRVALGLLREGDPAEPAMAGADLWHDCSTTVGDGGAPILSVASGKVLGVHLGGEFQRGNFGVSMWSFLARPEVQAILG